MRQVSHAYSFWLLQCECLVESESRVSCKAHHINREVWKPFGLPIREVYIASKKTEIESQQGRKPL